MHKAAGDYLILVNMADKPCIINTECSDICSRQECLSIADLLLRTHDCLHYG